MRKEMIEIIKDELNVKEVSFGDKVELNTTITPPLFIEGVLNELRHQIQIMRKEKGFKITDKIILSTNANELLNLSFIQKDILAEKIDDNIGDDFKIIEGFKVSIKQLK